MMEPAPRNRPAADRVLVLAESQRSHDPLVDRLGDDCEVVTATPEDQWDSFDLCVVDAATYPRVAAELTARKEAVAPVYLPVLLVVRDGDEVERLPVGESGGSVDDVVTVPGPAHFFELRVQSLLRARRFSRRLVEQRDRFSALVRSASDAIVVADDEGSIVFANEAAERLFGRPVAAVEGRSVSRLLPDEPGTDETGPVEQVLDRPDGTRVHVEVSVVPFDTPGERLVAYLVRNVTERVERETELETARRQLELAMEASDQTVWEFDPDINRIRIHGQGDSILGLGEEYDVETFGDILHPEDRERYEREVADAVENGEAYRQEVRFTHAETGEQRWLEIAGEVLPGSADEPRLIGTSRDVTERKRRERERERLVDLFEKTQAIADVAGWEYDIAADELLVTDQLRRLFGIGPGQPLELGPAIDSYHPADRDRVRAALDRAMETGESFALEARLVDADDRERWVEARGDRVEGPEGRVVLRGTLQDVTERVERQDELEQLVADLENAQEMANLGTWEYGLRTGDFHLSDRTRDIYGIDREADHAVERALSVHPPAGQVELYETFERAVETGEVVDLELPYETEADAGWVRIHGRVQYEDGEPVRIRGTVQDVTERVERVRELERSEVLIEESTDLNAILDQDGTFQYLTPSVEQVLGYEPEELVGENAFAYVHPDDVDATTEAFARTIDAPDVRPTAMFRFRRADGSWAVLEATGRNLLDDPHVEGIVAYTRDVTERVERTRELERYQTIVEAATDPVYALDANGRFTLVNDALVELSGYDRAELLGEPVSLVLEDETVAQSEEFIADQLSGEHDFATTEVSVSRYDGETRRYELSISPLFEGGAFAGTVGVARDVTELRERERRLSVLERVLRHNLRNKMNVVLANADELETGSDDETIHERIAAIRSASEDLLSLSEAVRRFHDSVDPTAGLAVEGDVVDHVETAVEEARLAHPEATVEIEAPPSARALLSESIELAFDELLENAIVHSDSSEPAVRVTVDAEADEVLVRVADEGPGLNPGERAALLRGVEGPLEHTSGLGLWLVRWTVDNVGGSLDVRDNDPRGTVVELRFRSPPAEQRP